MSTREWPAFSSPGGEGVSPQRRAWRALYKSYWALIPLMDRDLRDEVGIDLTTSNALLHTHLAGPDGLRMNELAHNATLSTSGLTSLVDRLEERGWMERVRDPDDRRAIRVVLTDEGREFARVAATVHVASIEQHFSSRVSDDDARAVARVLEAVESAVNED